MEDNKKIVAQVYPGRKFSPVIGSNDGLTGSCWTMVNT